MPFSALLGIFFTFSISTYTAYIGHFYTPFYFYNPSFSHFSFFKNFKFSVFDFVFLFTIVSVIFLALHAY